ncbi:phosphopantetheine-binding protein [Mesonia sp. MT50]|uniref:Acyl carrier protein n=1 Tax=Mesonia profundi TaxID=3070998 RepID=A0ABU1A0T5_9FLAO|nr:phosphopantetheine-binding protein [Mesonia profundi]MDQ7917313.1 phosphopantetheine-binding protein [Mesonia profundi]
MERGEIISKIDDFLVDEFEVEQSEISTTANLKDTLDLDSLDYVDLVVAIESSFGIKLLGEDFVNIDTFEDFYSLIDTKLKQ